VVLTPPRHLILPLIYLEVCVCPRFSICISYRTYEIGECSLLKPFHAISSFEHHMFFLSNLSYFHTSPIINLQPSVNLATKGHLHHVIKMVSDFCREHKSWNHRLYILHKRCGLLFPSPISSQNCSRKCFLFLRAIYFGHN
jgi:hypothetical protein